MYAKSSQLCPTLSGPRTVAYPTPLSMEFSRQEYWSGLPCLPPGDLPDPGIKPTCPASPALQVGSLLLSHQGSPKVTCTLYQYQQHFTVEDKHLKYVYS